MRFELRFSRRAARDLEAALRQTLRQFGERQLEEYKGLIREALVEIAENPLGPRSRHRPDLHRDARTLHIGRKGRRARHFFLYRVGSEFVGIARFLHDAMDLPRHLPDDFTPHPPADT